MKLTVNQSDLSRIMQKLQGFNAKINAYQFRWRIELLNEYKQKVSSMMGTISGRGGYPTIEITGTTIPNTDHWNALQPSTILAKTKAAYTQDNMHDVYSKWAVQTTIWEHTGRTKRSFEVKDNWVGINSSYAWKVEEGDPNNTFEGNDAPIKPRPLFGLANYVVRMAIRKACTDPGNTLGKRMRQEFVEFAESNGWGK